MRGGAGPTIAKLSVNLLAIATTLLKPGGGGGSVPQPTTVPSLLRANPWFPPAAIAITSRNPEGMLATMVVFNPQATTVPSLFSARLALGPAAMETTLLRSGGGMLSVEELW